MTKSDIIDLSLFIGGVSMKNIKKPLIILVSCLILIALVGCNKKSEESQKADDLIIAIGNVSKESGKQIEDAEFYYSMLSDKQKEQVEHYDYLLQAREEYDKLANFRTVPDVKNMTEEKAIATLEESEIKYEIEYRYKSNLDKGLVISSMPDADKEIDKDTTVKIIVSKGPETIECKDAIINWYSVGNKKDEWHFYTPYIRKEETIYMECEVTFNTSFEWKGTGIVEASTTEDFNKSVPANIVFSDQKVKAGEKQTIRLSAPLQGLGEDKPTNVYYKIRILVGGNEKELKVDFSMNW